MREVGAAVYANGEVCISILHAPGDDPNSYESASERWSPVQSVEKILLSVISMLAGTSLFPCIDLLERQLMHGSCGVQNPTWKVVRISTLA